MTNDRASAAAPAVPAPARRLPLHRRLLRGLLECALIYALVVCAIAWFQESLLFVPTALPPDYKFELADVDEVWIPVRDGRLHALHFRRPQSRGIVLFLHGNGGNHTSYLSEADVYLDAGYDVFMLDYRGYGKSGGRIDSEEQLHADVRAAWDAASSRYDGRRRVIHGRSLGTGPAARLAAEVQADLLVLVTPYSSIRRLAGELYPWVPRVLLRYPLETERWLSSIRMPVLIAHGTEDAMIPVDHARHLHALKPDSTLIVIPGVDHNGVQAHPHFIDTLLRMLGRLG